MFWGRMVYSYGLSSHGQISNHYRIEDWNLFNIPERWKADEWDGHTPVEAANRLYKFCLQCNK